MCVLCVNVHLRVSVCEMILERESDEGESASHGVCHHEKHASV